MMPDEPAFTIRDIAGFFVLGATAVITTILVVTALAHVGIV